MSRFWALATAALGVATLAVVAAFGMLPAVRAAYPNGDFTAALSAFQHATSMEQLYGLFGNPADPGKLAAMTAGNTLDLFVFIPTYGAFMLAGAAFLADGFRRPVAWIAILPALIGLVADVLETWSQIRVTSNWGHAAASLPLVAPACWAKFFGIAFHALGCSALALLGARKRWIIALLGLLPIIAVSADAAHALPSPMLLTASTSVFWIALMVIGLIGALRAPGASPPA